MIIKSVTHLRKVIKVGTEVKITYHLKSIGPSLIANVNLYEDEERPPRFVVECNTTGFTLATLNNGEWEGRRVDYPKAQSCRFDDGRLIIVGEDIDNPDNKQPIKWLTIEVLD